MQLKHLEAYIQLIDNDEWLNIHDFRQLLFYLVDMSYLAETITPVSERIWRTELYIPNVAREKVQAVLEGD